MATDRNPSYRGHCGWFVGAVWLLLVVGGAAMFRPAAAAEGFRLDSAVYASSEQDPISRSTTLFHEGVFYDFAGGQTEAIIFDTAGGRLVLVDWRRRIRTELRAKQLAAFTDQWRRWAESHEDPFLRFAAAPRFTTRHDPASGELALESQWASYRVRLVEPSSPTTAEAYRTFCDAMARLGPMLDGRARPPLLRLALDEEIARRGAVPGEIRLTLRLGRGRDSKGETSLRSTHRLVESLGPDDLERIDRLRGQIESLAPVTLSEYRRAGG